jgi:hypothetical protein
MSRTWWKGSTMSGKEKWYSNDYIDINEYRRKAKDSDLPDSHQINFGGSIGAFSYGYLRDDSNFKND